MDTSEDRQLLAKTKVALDAPISDEVVKWVAEGYSDAEIRDALAERGYEVSVYRVTRLRRKLSPRVAKYLAEHRAEVLSTILEAHKPTRVQRVARVMQLLEEGIRKTAEAGQWIQVARLADVFLKCNRYIAEETNDIPAAAHGVNFYLTMIQQVPEPVRATIMQKFAELRQMLAAATGQEPPQPAMDAEFTAEDE